MERERERKRDLFIHTHDTMILKCIQSHVSSFAPATKKPGSLRLRFVALTHCLSALGQNPWNPL